MGVAQTKKQITDYIWSYNACDTKQPRSRIPHYLQIMVMVGRDLAGGMLTLRAMSLVYTTLLSIVPLLAVSISVLKGFGVHDQLEPALVNLLAPLGEQSTEISSRIVGFVDNMNIGVLGALGLSLLIFTVVSLIQKIESAFNYTWRLQSSRNLMQRFSNYLSVVLVGPVLIFSAVGITASLNSNTILELPYLSDLVRFGGNLLPYTLVIGAFSFIYLLVPNIRVKPRSALFGAIIAGILWETSGILFASFAGSSTSYTVIYSSFVIMLMFMIWLYLSWLILLIGSSIAYYHQHPEGLKWQKRYFHLSARMREQLVLQLMVNIAQTYDQQSQMPTTIDRLASYQQAPAEVLGRMLAALEDDGMVLRTNDRPPGYIPAKSLNRIRLIDILRSSREAEDNRQRENLYCDPAVGELMQSIETQYEIQLGDQTLADFLAANPLAQNHENSLV
ncbi:MAG: YihY family inner membrane protein [Gammaproteobacteria bacterium]|nr:YihY family inner membrane protein [Gammaproteobacteria bacterium]